MPLALRCSLALLLLAAMLGASPSQAQNYIRQIAPGQFSFGYGIAVDTIHDSNIVISDVDNDHLLVYSATGSLIRTIGSAGTGNGQFYAPFGIAVDSAHDGNIVVADSGNNRIQVLGADGSFIRAFGSLGSGNGQLNDPGSVAVDTAHSSNIIVMDEQNNRIVVFSSTGTFIKTLVPALIAMVSMTVDPATGNVYVVTAFENPILYVYNPDGALIQTITNFQDETGQQYYPDTLAVDAANGGNLVIRGSPLSVAVFSPTGTFIKRLATGGSLVSELNATNIATVALDPANGNNVVVADTTRIAVFSNTGASPIAASILPGSRSVATGNAATVFATMLNAGSAALDNCQIGVQTAVPYAGTLDYQTTDPATNALTGQKDTPVTIPAQGSQTFALTFTPSAAQSALGLSLNFSCAGVQPAQVTPGVNTIDLNAETKQPPDIIALAATPSADGILDLPLSSGGAAAFAVATSNAGSPISLTVSADTGGATLPLSLSVCQTNPATGQCLTPPAASLPVTIEAGATPTFSIFAGASTPIPFAPGASRVFVRFKESANAVWGETSVAVRTQ